MSQVDEYSYNGNDQSTPQNGLSTMNERVSRLAAALRSKLKHLMEVFGEDPVKQLMPPVVDVLESLNSSMIEGEQNATALKELTNDHEALLQQYKAEKEKRSKAEKRVMKVEDELNGQVSELNEAGLRLKDEISQLTARLKTQKEKNERLEQKVDQIQLNHNDMQEKHTKTLHQYAVLARQTSKISLVRSSRAGSVDLLRSATSEDRLSLPGSPSKIRVRTSEPELVLSVKSRQGTEDREEKIENSSPLPTVEVEKPKEEDDVFVQQKDFSDRDRKDEEMFAMEAEERKLEVVAEGNEESLMDELGEEAIEINEAAEMAKVNQEIKNLLSEKSELFSERNQLSNKCDDLSSEVEELNRKRATLSEKVKVSQTENATFKEEIKKLKEMLEEKKDKEETVYTEESKRYTRLEMAKILEQRDFYKSRYLDIEDRLKSSEELPLITSKPKGETSGVRGFFQSLFGPKKKSVEQRTEYGISQSDAYTYLKGNDQANTAAIDSDDGCVQAYGWSLPGREFRSGSLSLEPTQTGGRRLPLPVSPWASFAQPVPSFADYGPLPKQEKQTKVTCAISINSCDWCNPSVEPVVVPSTDAQVWICTHSADQGSHVVVLNGNNPSSDEAERFPVSDSPIISAISLPSAASGKKSPSAKGYATVWLGTKSEYIYVYPTVGDHTHSVSVKVPAVPLHFLYGNNKVVVGMSTAMIQIFSRLSNGQWNLENWKKIQMGQQPEKPIAAMAKVEEDVWISVASEVYVLEAKSLKADKLFTAHNDADVVISHMAAMGDGVWIAFKPNCNLRLYHAKTLEHVQDLNLSPRVQRLLGVPGRTASSLKVTSMLLAHGALWVGTSTGVILSAPLTLDQKRQLHLLERAGSLRTPILASKLPCCFESDIRVFLHGHTLGVSSLIATPVVASQTCDNNDDYVFVDTRETIVISAGEGFIDFRAKDGTLASRTDAASDVSRSSVPRSPTQSPDRVHVCAWLISTKSVSQ